MKKFLNLVVLTSLLLAGCTQPLLDSQEPIKSNAPQNSYASVSEDGKIHVDLARLAAVSFIRSQEGVGNIEAFDTDSFPDQNGVTACYIFNFMPAGFVVTSANLKNYPIMAYGTNSSFPEINSQTPISMLFWLSQSVLLNDYIKIGSEKGNVPFIVPQSNKYFLTINKL